MKIPIVGSTYEMDARSFDVQRCINLYPITTEVNDSKSVSALRGTPGLSTFATAGDGPHRGSITAQGRAFVISGDGFYEVFSDGTTTLHGSLNTQTGTVGIDKNLTQIIVVDGSDGWIFTPSRS